MRPGQHKRLANWAIGLIAIALIAIGTAWAFTKQLPWTDAYEVQAVFPSAQNLRVDSPVRIAGVNVGKVARVESLSPEAQQPVSEPPADADADGADADAGPSEDGGTLPAASIVTMELEESGRPIKSDATFRLLPRLFLEGNLFVELRPGSPSAPEVDEGHVYSLDRTSNSVQLDQILTTLQADVREQLQITLEELGSALVDHGGAKGFQELYRSSPGANRYTSQVNEAFLGEEPHDLSNLVRNLDRVLRGLGRNEESLKDLVTNFRIFAGSFAAEDRALERAIAEIPDVFDAADPAFVALNRAFPPVRAFAREALPGTRTQPEALDAATPLLRQLRLLSEPSELQGLARDLEPTVEHLAEVAEGSDDTFELVRPFASCFNEVIIPWQNMTVPAQGHPATGRVYQEASYGLVGIAGESRSGDANGQYIRTQAGGGANTVFAPNPEGADSEEELVGVTPFPILNSEPSINDSVKPRFRPDEPCEEQDPPNLGTRLGGAPEQGTAPSSLPSEFQATIDEFEQMVTALGEAQAAVEDEPGRASRRGLTQATRRWGDFLEGYEAQAKGALLGGER